MTHDFAVQNEKFIVAENMKRHGGSFVQALGEALIHADPENTRRINEAFPEYWKTYLEWGSIK